MGRAAARRRGAGDTLAASHGVSAGRPVRPLPVHLPSLTRHACRSPALGTSYQQFIAALGCTFNISAGARELLVRSHEVPRHQPRSRAPLRPETLQRLGITPSEPPSLATNFTRIAVGDVSPETRRQVIADNALDVELVDFTYGLWRHRWPRLRTMCASA